MFEISEVAVTIEQPANGKPGRVSYGRYAVEVDRVVMYDENDEPMKDKRGNRYELLIGEGVEPEQLASILTKRIRRDRGGGHTRFGAPFNFPDETFV
jgi:hypothetical protein